MARNPSAPVKTPGVVTSADTDETDMDQLEKDSPGLDDGAAEPAAKPQTVSMTVAELQALVSAEVSKVLQSQRPAEINAQPAALPDQSEINIDEITRPTLSKQGYVVPRNYGEPANPAVKRD